MRDPKYPLVEAIKSLLPHAEAIGEYAGTEWADDNDLCQETHWLREHSKEIRQLLAAAEAREARPLPEVLEVARKAITESSCYVTLYKQERADYLSEEDHAECDRDKALCDSALATIAACRAGTAEALRLLEEIREECDNHADVEDAGSTEDEPQRVRPNLAMRMQTLADRAIAALRGGGPENGQTSAPAGPTNS